MAYNTARILPSLFYLAALPISSATRTFHSRDATVSLIIANCTTQLEAKPDDVQCTDMLACILNTVDAATAARWSAGASILAFIPTIATLISNSMDEILLTAEDSLILAIFLALESITAFTTRSAQIGGNDCFGAQAPQSLKKSISEGVERACKTNKVVAASRKRQRLLFLVVSILLLSTACVAIWYPVYLIHRNGVVVFSCPVRIHLPIYLALVQAVTLANIALRGVTVKEAKISLRQQNRHATSSPWPEVLILRCPKTTTGATLIRGVTSILSFGLYVFATGVLSAMTMYPASDAIRALVLFAVSAGVARMVVGSMGGSQFKTSLVINVPRRHLEELTTYAKSVVHNVLGAQQQGGSASALLPAPSGP